VKNIYYLITPGITHFSRRLWTLIGACLATAFTSLFSACAQLEATPQSATSAPARPAAGASLPESHASVYVLQPQPRPGSCTARGSGRSALPDAHCTPGAIDPAVTQANVFSTICRDGYTRGVRPPESITAVEKRASMRAYADTGPASAYEYDHLVPLELGGARNDARDLWPQPGRTRNPKDALESRLREMVCAGGLGLATAQRRIARDWVGEYRRLFG
jgi:hypothetical protein